MASRPASTESPPRWTPAIGDKNEKWLFFNQVCERYGIPERTLRQWRSDGVGPPFSKIGRWLRVSESDAEKWWRVRAEQLKTPV